MTNTPPANLRHTVPDVARDTVPDVARDTVPDDGRDTVPDDARDNAHRGVPHDHGPWVPSGAMPAVAGNSSLDGRPVAERRSVTVSVVVISKDEPALADTLDALAAWSSGLLDDVVVVDASDGRLDAIRDARRWVRWIPYARPPGAGITIPEQRNVGVRAAIGDVVVFTDCGCVPDSEWLPRLLAPILEGHEHVTCGRTGSRGVSVYDGVPAGSSPESPPEHVDECPTINMAFRRDAFDRVGGFDETFDYGSDIDFSWRLTAAGFRIRYVPDAVVVHEWGDGARQRRRAVQYGRARARLYRKHPDRLGAMLRRDPIVAAYPLFLLGLPLTARWRWYPALLVVPLWRNRGKHPVRVVVDHLWFGAGVLRELGSGALAATGGCPVRWSEVGR